jgi:hypothetical protein
MQFQRSIDLMVVFNRFYLHGGKIEANVHTIEHVKICNPILMHKPNHNPNCIDRELLEPVEVYKYLGCQYLLGVIFNCSSAQDVMGDRVW